MPIAAHAARLRAAYGLPAGAQPAGHDDLQALVAALPAVGLLGGPATPVPHGRPPRLVGGVRVEGLIWDACPTAMRPTLIVVAGAPGSGKTTLARELSARLDMPLLAKDDVKEALFDALGTGDREWSRRLGSATYEVLFVVARRLLESGTSCLVESNFIDVEPFRALPPARVVQLFCSAPAGVVLERYAARRRHPGHLDEAIVEELRRRLDAGEWRPLELDGELIELDTAQAVDVDALVARLG